MVEFFWGDENEIIRLKEDKPIKKEKTNFEIKNRRYLGSKEKLLPFIQKVVHKHTRKVKTVADIFGGTGVVADMFAKEGKQVIVNDILHSNYLIYQTFFGNEAFNVKLIEKALKIINDIQGYGDEYFKKSIWQ